MAVISPTAKQQFLDLNGDLLIGGFLHTTESTTDTDKATWKEEAETNVNDNPIELDSRGECDLWLTPGEAYRFRLETALGDLIWQRDGIIGSGSGSSGTSQVTNIADLKNTSPSGLSLAHVLGYYIAGDGGGALWFWNSTSTASDNGITVIELNSTPIVGRWERVNVDIITFKQAGATGDGAVDDTAFINAAFAVAANIVGTEGSYLISGAITVPTGVKLAMDEGASFTAASTQTVTVTTGGTFECGISQCFAGSVEATFGSGTYDEVYTEWFGAAGDGSTDDTLAIARALGSGDKDAQSADQGGTLVVKFLESEYSSDSIEWPIDYQVVMKGTGFRGTVFKPRNTDSTSFIHVGTVDKDSYKPVMKNFQILGTATCGHGIHFDTPKIGPDIDDVWVRNCTGVGKSAILLQDTFIASLRNIKLLDNYNGLTLDGSKGIVATGANWLADNTNLGLNLINTTGTTQGNDLHFMEIGLGSVDATKKAVYCESSNNKIDIDFYENFSNAQSIRFTSTARNNVLNIRNGTTTQYRDEGYSNSIPMGFSITQANYAGSNNFSGALIGNGLITNQFWNSSYFITSNSGFTGVSTSAETGTITAAAASTTIEGVGTSFVTDPDIIAGGTITWTDDAAATIVRRIASITDEDTLELTAVAGSIATGVAFASTGQPLRSISVLTGYLDNNSLELDWGTKAPVNGSVEGVRSNQTFAVSDGDTVIVMMMIKSDRDFASDEYMQLRVVGAASENRAISAFSNISANTWTPVTVLYKVGTSENVRIQVDMHSSDTRTAITTNLDDFLFTTNIKNPTLIYNPNAASSASSADGAYIPRLKSQLLDASGKVIFSGIETTAAGGTTTALSLDRSLHSIDADAGGDIFTLADGTIGQIMTIGCLSATGVCTVTPANFLGGTSVTMNAAGETVTLQFIDTNWYIIGGHNYTVI